MKAAHTTMSISRKAGGLQFSVMGLCKTLRSEQGVSVEVLSAEDEYSGDDLPKWEPVRPHVYPVRDPTPFGFAPGMLREMRDLAPDVVHCHGLWLYPSLATVRWASGGKRPYVISPRGMLDPVDLAKSRAKKRLALWLYQGRHLRNARCMHALCESEAASIRAFGLRTPVCVVPNGVNLPTTENGQCEAPWNAVIPAGRRILLYLARVNPKKGLTQLVDAVARVKQRNKALLDGWCLAIVGWDQGGYEALLKQRVRESNIEQDVFFLGPMFGKEKEAAYRHASAYTLPSTSEGLPNSVLEAWSYGLPVVMTPQCNIPEGFAASAALNARPEPDDLARALEELFQMSDADRADMGARGRQLVCDRFTWSRVAAQTRKVYEWLLGGGSAPECIRTTS